MIFSDDGKMLAFSDGNCGVGLFKKQPVKLKTEDDQAENIQQRIEWVFIGKAKAHSKEVISKIFSTKIRCPFRPTNR